MRALSIFAVQGEEPRINSIPIPLIGGFRPSLSGLGFGLEFPGVTHADTLAGLPGAFHLAPGSWRLSP